jgi:hypothetical protein
VIRTLRPHTESPVPAELRQRIARALDEVDAARRELEGVERSPGSLARLRAAHARLRNAYLDADRQLRAATSLAKAHSRGEWMRWRRRLSENSTARQQHLFAEQDASCVLPAGTVQAVDSGMSGPAIGELQHGESAMPGATAEYGVDMEGYCLHRECC